MELKDSIIIVLTYFIYITHASSEISCERPTIIELVGDAVISGYFHIHNGPNCTQADAIGLQQMAASAWIVNTINKFEILPGAKIGFAVYDACSTSLDEVILSNSDESCKRSYNLGILTTPEISQKFESEQPSNETFLFLTNSESPLSLFIEITVRILEGLNWTVIDYVLAPTEDVLELFKENILSNDVCVLNHYILPDFENVFWRNILLHNLSPSKNNTLFIVFGTWEHIHFITEAMAETDFNVQWILVPLNSTTQNYDIESAPINSLVVLPGIGILHEKKTHDEMNIPMAEEQMYDNMSVHQEKRIFISYPLFMNVAFPILNILNTFKHTLVEYCSSVSNDEICSFDPSFQDEFNFYNLTDYRSKRDAVLHMVLSSDYTVVTAASRVGDHNKLEDFAYFVEDSENNDSSVSIRIISSVHKEVFTLENCDDFKLNNSMDSKCNLCSNVENNNHLVADRAQTVSHFYYNLTWRPEAWVAAVASIGAVGVTCALAIMIFIGVRVCKGDILEGNPVFSFLLLVSITFTYVSTLPYSFYSDDTYLADLFCILRVTGTSLSYAFLFSIMLTRCLMLAVFDNGVTFMNHINGFLQSILWFFILGVQVALSAQVLIIKSEFFTADNCRSMYEGYNLQILLSYDLFLLLLLVCTSPFSVRSKRNYSEGIFFTVATYLSLLIWISWTTAFLLLPEEWKDVCISGGLTATASAILVSVFIPRTYLMMTAIVRDNLASALPSLACTNSTSILDINYRTTSNQVLYDCVNPFPGEQLNPNFYSEQPHAVSFVKPEDNDPTEATYEMYDSPTSPNKVTHF